MSNDSVAARGDSRPRTDASAIESLGCQIRQHWSAYISSPALIPRRVKAGFWRFGAAYVVTRMPLWLKVTSYPARCGLLLPVAGPRRGESGRSIFWKAGAGILTFSVASTPSHLRLAVRAPNSPKSYPVWGSRAPAPSRYFSAHPRFTHGESRRRQNLESWRGWDLGGQQPPAPLRRRAPRRGLGWLKPRNTEARPPRDDLCPRRHRHGPRWPI